jgi:hypothetical protein
MRVGAEDVTSATAHTATFYDPNGDVLVEDEALSQDGTTGWWECDLDISSWDLGMNYRAQLDFTVDTVDYQDHRYFDVVKWPSNEPLLTTEELETEHPTWTQVRPVDWSDWTTAIKIAHRRLTHTLRGMRDNRGEMLRPALILDRAQMRELEMRFVESVIAEESRFPREEIEYRREQAVNALANFANFWVDRNDDLVADADDEAATGPSFVR